MPHPTVWIVFGILCAAAICAKAGLMLGRRRAAFKKRMELKKAMDVCAVEDCSGPLVAYKCGHEFAENFYLRVYGFRFGLSDEARAARLRCGDCDLAKLKEISTRCAACGMLIMPGEGIALYAENGSFLYADSGTKFTHPDGRVSVVGCMGWDCCPSGGFFAGHWSSTGLKPLNPEGNGLAAHTMLTGNAVVMTIKTSVRQAPKPEQDTPDTPH